MHSDLIGDLKLHPQVEEIQGIPGASIIHGLLTREEAKNFIEEIQFDELIDTTGTRLKDDYKASMQRICKRFKQDMPELAEKIYERLKHVVPEIIEYTEEDDELGPFLVGQWRFNSVNERISFLKYEPGGVFSKHRDGIFIKHEDLRSLITVLVYLNDDYEGGRTKAFSDCGQVEAEIQPVVGDAFMMIQRVLHEGGVVRSGFKYVVRFDLMFYRERNLSKEEMNRNELAAEYLKMANEFERSHQGNEAVKYYRMAFKLNPKLEEML